MNIGDVEQALGMTRANIRFYEREGLLEPVRSENGYRDYSERDVETLKKIKLLRQLHLDLETIRALQRGEVELAAVLRERQAELMGEAADLERARAICSAMEADGASYGSLDPGRYLVQVPQVNRGYFAPPADAPPTVQRPWSRFVARWLDAVLYGLVWLAIHTLILRFQMPGGLGGSVLGIIIDLGLLLLFEPVLLATWGYTPGKWLLGLKVRAADGRKLTWGEALARTKGVIARGYGFGIPIYNLYRAYRCYKGVEEGAAMDWEEDCSYTAAPLKPLRSIGTAAALLLTFVLMFAVISRGQMPKYRGDLTAAQFYDNCNDLKDYLGMLDRYDLNDQGEWVERARESGTFYIDLYEADQPAYRVSLTDGKVTGVTLETVCSDQGAGFLLARENAAYKLLAASAFVGAQREFNVFSWPASNILKRIEDGALDSYTFEAGGVVITQTVEYSGFELINDEMLIPVEGASPYIRILFTMEKR